MYFRPTKQMLQWNNYQKDRMNKLPSPCHYTIEEIN